MSREEKLKAIGMLVETFPASLTGVSDSRLDVYELAVANTPAEFVLAAAVRFTQGAVPGQHTRFAPEPPQFNTEARDLWYASLDAERRDRQRYLPALAEPDLIPDPASVARVKAMVAGFNGLANTMLTPDAAETKAKADRKARFAARSAPDPSPEDTRLRLMGSRI